ncbi:3-deoxy-D-manno-octulosonic acid transferase [Babesia caballi]|uniref:3-deoxy-D-manno-octulosonic acid transferase n=1 Tax=Babesia caballi TaxID=5871 RepID=A0AAV4LL77_BABCB|nr:3-deoxy-D-manno-octulosonic acid transferase [Babesia caballi]
MGRRPDIAGFGGRPARRRPFGPPARRRGRAPEAGYVRSAATEVVAVVEWAPGPALCDFLGRLERRCVPGEPGGLGSESLSAPNTDDLAAGALRLLLLGSVVVVESFLAPAVDAVLLRDNAIDMAILEWLDGGRWEVAGRVAASDDATMHLA